MHIQNYESKPYISLLSAISLILKHCLKIFNLRSTLLINVSVQYGNVNCRHSAVHQISRTQLSCMTQQTVTAPLYLSSWMVLGGKKKSHNHPTRTHFKFMTKSLQWALNTTWQLNLTSKFISLLPRWLLGTFSSILKSSTSPPTRLSAEVLIIYFIEKMDAIRRKPFQLPPSTP
jgi:hypothetical protein